MPFAPFSGALRQARLAKGLNQGALGRELGVGQQAVSAWESGRSEPDLATLVALAAVLETRPEALLSAESVPAADLRWRHLEVVPDDVPSEAATTGIGTSYRDQFIDLVALRFRHGPLSDAEVTFLRDLARSAFGLDLLAGGPLIPPLGTSTQPGVLAPES